MEKTLSSRRALGAIGLKLKGTYKCFLNPIMGVGGAAPPPCTFSYGAPNRELY